MKSVAKLIKKIKTAVVKIVVKTVTSSKREPKIKDDEN